MGNINICDIIKFEYSKKPSIKYEQLENRFQLKFRDGQGIHVYQNGDRYEGQWFNYKKHGQGSYYYQNGDLYTGSWYEDKKHGHGKFFYKKGDRYIGLWAFDKKEGEGTTYYRDGSFFKVEYTNSYNLNDDQERPGHETLIENNNSYEKSLKNSSNQPDSLLQQNNESYLSRPDDKLLESIQNTSQNNDQKFQEKFNSCVEYFDLNRNLQPLVEKNIKTWNKDDINEWLACLELQCYQKKFQDNHITGRNLFDLSDEELKNDMGILSVGHRKNIMKSIQKLIGLHRDPEIQKVYKRNQLINVKQSQQYKRQFQSLNSLENKIKEIKNFNKFEVLYQQQKSHNYNSIDEKDSERSSGGDGDDELEQKNIENQNQSILSSFEKTQKKISSKSFSSINISQEEQVDKQSPFRKNSSSNTRKSSINPNLSDQSQDEMKQNNSSFDRKEKTEANKNELNEIYETSSDSSSSKSIDSLNKSQLKNVQSSDEEQSPIKLNRHKSEMNKKNKKDKMQKGKSDHHNVSQTSQDNNYCHNFLKELGLSNCVIKINEINFKSKIGQGGYGEVYLGEWLGQEVAIKQFGNHKQIQKKKLANFVKEVDVISKLRHPNIVLYMGVCIDQNRYLMITEYLNQGSLFDHIHKKHTNITISQQLDLIEDIALGMVYLHSRQVLHCDLKSSNILIDQNWNIKLCDFGLSQAKSKIRQKNTKLIGTPNWMAPEILRGEKYDEFSDVYSYGMIIWELVTLSIPYYNLSTQTIIESVGYHDHQVDIPNQGNALMMNIMQACLNKNRKLRPTFKKLLVQIQDTKKTINMINSQNNKS